eukprot:gnl/MRDRNA2_/MRDRNA2_101761_c0_seq1.p1 gnl/MRDRNA2_/MRDRNA2_101761_c0~~gnl/MRDRNA2_/MRDRNA2_101761_c0_seq1.p1  ORF type:complete len:183 (+),score=12.37 gnl/MRDRNA2_/MRDRNA2_101761_c0_seq1:81-629(+)
MPYYRPNVTGYGTYPTSYCADGSGRDLHTVHANLRCSGNINFLNSSDSAMYTKAFGLRKNPSLPSSFFSTAKQDEVFRKTADSAGFGSSSFCSSRDSPGGLPDIWAKAAYGSTYRANFCHSSDDFAKRWVSSNEVKSVLYDGKGHGRNLGWHKSYRQNMVRGCPLLSGDDVPRMAREEQRAR